jgi:hypothetical protein
MELKIKNDELLIAIIPLIIPPDVFWLLILSVLANEIRSTFVILAIIKVKFLY